MSNKINPVWNENFSAIAINCSNEYVPYLSVCLKSIVNTASENHNYDIIICEKFITEENKRILTEFISRKNISIRFLNIVETLKNEEFPEIYPGYTIESYAILFTPLLFKNYERILFTDCDLIFERDIQELYHIDLEGKVACAVKDLTMTMLVNSDDKIWKKHVFEELQLKNKEEYFNSGVMVYDIKKCDEVNFTKDTLEIAKYPQLIFIQGILNKFFQGQNIKYMDNKFNLDLIASHEKYLYDNFMEEKYKNMYLKALNEAHVLHWAGIRKPWFYLEETLSYKWWNIAKTTPFYEVIFDRYLQKSFAKCEQGIEEIKNYTLNLENKQDEIKNYILNLENKQDELRVQIVNTMNYKKNLLNYYRVRLFCNLTFGKRKEHYKNKKLILKHKLEQAEQLMNSY